MFAPLYESCVAVPPHLAFGSKVMKTKRIVVLILLTTVCLGGATFLARAANDRIDAKRQQRERYFIAVHFLAWEAALEGDETVPRNLDQLLQQAGGRNSGLMTPFRDGLVFASDGAHFTLAEPHKSRVSLFQKDRLVATDLEWPRWESSRLLARKFDEQVVPPPGFK